jgi:hypothetical protein
MVRIFVFDKIVLSSVALGLGLAVLFMLWRLNPVETSATPHFLDGSALGGYAVLILWVGCFLAWIFSAAAAALPLSYEGRKVAGVLLMLCSQAAIYAFLGMWVSALVKWIQGRRVGRKAKD